jgi:hypothetical protein
MQSFNGPYINGSFGDGRLHRFLRLQCELELVTLRLDETLGSGLDSFRWHLTVNSLTEAKKLTSCRTQTAESARELSCLTDCYSFLFIMNNHIYLEI